MKKLSIEQLLLITLSIFALFIRVYKLDILPGGLHEDEVSNAYAGRFILENGHDLWPWLMIVALLLWPLEIGWRRWGRLRIQ